jgi:hypothetical protein
MRFLYRLLLEYLDNVHPILHFEVGNSLANILTSKVNLLLFHKKMTGDENKYWGK